MKIAKTAQEWINIEALGTWQEEYKNGDLWNFLGDIWYLSILELPPKELEELHTIMRIV